MGEEELERAEPRDRPPIQFKPVPMPPPDPWLKRKMPALIAGGILLLIASYVYGCTRVAQKQRAFNEQLGDLGRVLENHNARGETVTPASIVEDVKHLADEVGVSLDDDEIEVAADRIEVVRAPHGGCEVAVWPETVKYLSNWSYQRLMKEKQSCGIPRWIVGVKVDATVRWGLASEDLVFEKYTPVLKLEDPI